MQKASASAGGDDLEASGARPRPPAASELKERETTLRTRAEVLARATSSDPGLAEQAGQAYCALGRFYAHALNNARSAIEAFRRASELDPRSIEAIREARILYTKARRYHKALRMLLAEQARIEDVPQRIELYRDEGALRRKVGDLPGGSQALRLALRLDPENWAVIEELARSILERVRSGYEVHDTEREEAASLFTALARSLSPKPRPLEGLEPSTPQVADTVPPPRQRVQNQADAGRLSSASAGPAPEQVHDGWTRPAPQPEEAALSPGDWTGPDSDWPRESPDTLDVTDYAAIGELRKQSSVPPAPASPARVSPAPPVEPVISERPPPAAERAPNTTLLPPPSGEVESVLVFELRTPSAKPPPVAESRPVPGELPAIATGGLERSAPPRTSESQRPPGDALIGRLFEVLHTLEFLSDAQSGAEFVLRLTMDTLEVQIGIVHLYDINARSFIIASAGGPKADALIELRSPETEPLLAEAMACGKPLLLAQAQGHPLTSSGRWALLDCARTILCAPLQQEGRFLGAVEVANPIDGSAFTEDDLNAISYVAERFTRFLGARGIVLSTDDVGAAE